MTTIHDIATNLGITAATVSRAVNEKPGVGAAPRETIREEAARLNFVTNGAAQPVRSARTKTAAMTVARLTSTDTVASEPVYGPIMLGIEQELEQYGYHFLICMNAGPAGRARKGLTCLHSGTCATTHPA